MSHGIIAPYRVPALLELSRVGEQPALVYKYVSLQADRLVVPDHRTLSSFRGLVNATDQEILDFAKRFGVLEWPPESEKTLWEKESASKFDEIPLATKKGERYDFLGQWRALAQELDAFIKIARDLGKGEDPSDELWKDLFGRVPSEARERRFENKRALLLNRFNDRIEMSDLRPMLSRKSDDYRITFAGGNLKGALLGLTIQGLIGQRLRICARCSEIFEPQGKRKYCEGCPQGAHADAARRHRKRKASTRSPV